MSKTFNEFVAQRLFKHFTVSSTQTLPGERFLLVLDHEQTVFDVYQELKNIAKENGDYQVFSYEGYETYSIQIPGTRLVVAAKYNSVLTDDFLTTLRNANLGNAHYPILILAESTIDSISSGTRDLSSAGMPFNHAEIQDYINNAIKDYRSKPLEEAILKKGYEALNADRYTDKSALKEYEPLLIIFEHGTIKKKDYPKLGFFPFEDYPIEKKQINNEVNDNTKYFEVLQRMCSRFDYESIKNDFGKTVKKKIEQNLNDNEPWYNSLTYEMVKKGYDQAHQNSDKIPDIETDSIWFTALDGKQIDLSYQLHEVKKNKFNLYIYNPDQLETIVLNFETTRKASSFIQKPEKYPEPVADKKKVSWQLKADGCSFYSIKTGDGGKIELRICILNLPDHFLPTKDQSYDLKVVKTEKNCRIVASIDQPIFTLNEQGTVPLNVDFSNIKTTYSMTISNQLHLQFEESDLIERPVDPLYIEIGNVNIPFKIQGQSQTVKELDGKAVLLKKLIEKKSFTGSGINFYMGAEKFKVKSRTSFKDSLFLEQEFLDQKLIIAHFEDDLRNTLEKDSLEDLLDPEIKTAYLDILHCFQKDQTLPSLAYYSGKTLDTINRFLNLFKAILENIKDHNPLKEKENAALYMGSILDFSNNKVWFTPLSPLNLLYQVELQKNTCGALENRFAEMLSPQNLIPYIKAPIPSTDQSHSFAIVEQGHSPEWRYYSEKEITESLISRSYVKTIVKNKIIQYHDHFPFLFEDPSSLIMNINLISMGNCEEVFDGIIDYYAQNLKTDHDPDGYLQFCISIYKTRLLDETAFDRLMDSEKLEKYLEEHIQDKKVEIVELASILTSKLKIYNFEYGEAKKTTLRYAHLSFIEMKSNPMTGTQEINTMPTGMAIGGLISGVSSAMKADNVWYNSGFGMKYAPENDFTKKIARMNAAYSIAFTGSDFSPITCLNTQINAKQDVLLRNLYDSSNWVVFINPKVDLSFFKNPGVADDLMIIHYSDQLSPASGYDDITVTAKVKQYESRIREYLESSGAQSSQKCIEEIIQLFNAVNGDWLLRMNSENFTDNRSYFSKEKMSILSAVRLLLAYTGKTDVIWVPMSLEEILRVSGSVGLSQKDGRLSARNLGFENQQPKCDDILLVGFRSVSADEPLQVVFHPVEVKIGQNDSTTISKAKTQSKNTLEGLKRAIFPEEADTLAARLLQTFFLQQVLLAAEKIKAFQIYPDTNWDRLIQDWRRQLLNNDVVYAQDLNGSMGATTIISFKNDAGKGTLEQVKEDNLGIDLLTLPIQNGVKYLTEDYQTIRDELSAWKLLPLMQTAKYIDQEKINDITQLSAPEKPIILKPVSIDLENSENTVDTDDERGNEPEKPESEKQTELPENTGLSQEQDESQQSSIKPAVENTSVPADDENKIEHPAVPSSEQYMEILFGTSVATGKPVYWQPNNSEVVVNLNTGVIGTSGTGKTQFVKSLIAQLMLQKNRNFNNEDFGILIFDYKGDYNETKKDFYDLLKPTILKLEDLPVNPFSLEGAKTGQSRIPMHRARGFMDTISKAYNLGNVQQKNLKDSIITAFKSRGIDVQYSSTWNKLPPTLHDVYLAYQGNDEIKKGDSLDAALEELEDFGIFEANPAKAQALYNLVKGVVVVDLTTTDSNSIRSLVVAVMLDLFYQQMLAHGSSRINGKYRELTKFILVDEADNFMSQNFESLKKILKEGREFGVGMILSTQYLNHFDYGEDNYARYINTWIIHEFKGGKPAEMDLIFGTAKPDARQEKLEQISRLQKFHSIVKIGTGLPQVIRDYSFYLLLEEMEGKNEQF